MSDKKNSWDTTEDGKRSLFRDIFLAGVLHLRYKKREKEEEIANDVLIVRLAATPIAV